MIVLAKAHVGRAIRQQQRMDARETPALAAERIRHRQVSEQVIREREQRYPVLTAENAAV